MGEEGARQTKNLPLFCLANYNAFKHTVITISNLVIILSLNYLIYIVNNNICMYNSMYILSSYMPGYSRDPYTKSSFHSN